MNHVFDSKHGFGVLATTTTEQRTLMTQILQSVGPLDDGLYNGVNPIIRVVEGTTVHVEGAVTDGVFKIGTAWVLP